MDEKSSSSRGKKKPLDKFLKTRCLMNSNNEIEKINCAIHKARSERKWNGNQAINSAQVRRSLKTREKHTENWLIFFVLLLPSAFTPPSLTFPITFPFLSTFVFSMCCLHSPCVSLTWCLENDFVSQTSLFFHSDPSYLRSSSAFFSPCMHVRGAGVWINPSGIESIFMLWISSESWEARKGIRLHTRASPQPHWKAMRWS